METSESEIPRYVFEDLLFARRLQRNLNAELERLNTLLAEQVRLLECRKQLMSDIHQAIQQRWKEEETLEPELHSAMDTEEGNDAR